MKTTLEIPDPLFRQTKATAALRGESLREFVASALQARLDRLESAAAVAPGWRRVFGAATREQVEEVDAVVDEELERIEPEAWQ